MPEGEPRFRITILRQGWMGEPEEWFRDTCSGGALRVTINGVVVADHDDYGIVQSALGLLRTVDRDHHPADRAVHGYLLCHHCGFPYFACSNFGTTWTVRHDGPSVVIGGVSHHGVLDVPKNRDSVAVDLDFPAASTRLPIEQYRAEIVAFATAARDFYFADGPKVLDDPDEREMHDQFWAEYDGLLARHGGPPAISTAATGPDMGGGLE